LGDFEAGGARRVRRGGAHGMDGQDAQWFQRWPAVPEDVGAPGEQSRETIG
jgi:hypothetical protein